MKTLPGIFYVTTEDTGLNVRGIQMVDKRSLDVRLVCNQMMYSDRWTTWPPFFDQSLSKSGRYPTGSLPKNGVTPALLSELGSEAVTTLLTMDRHNWTGASLHSMMQLIDRYLAVWNDLLNDLSPDCVVFHDSPHWGSAHVLYRLCLAREIPTVIVLNTLFEHRLIVRPRISAANERFEMWSCDRSDLVPSSYVTTGIPSQRWSSAIKSSYSSVTRLLKLVDPRSVKTALRYRPRDFPEVIPERPVGPMYRLAFNWDTASRIRRVAATLTSKSQRSLPDAPYVYFPLHLQPEATTVPLGGLFWDQLNVARLIADALPDGWVLLVKEHPQMFRYDREWTRARSETFYDELLRIPELILLDVGVNSGKAIANAAAVATITGTAGWEALQMGKPVLAFGYPWYRSLPGVTLPHLDEGFGPNLVDYFLSASDRGPKSDALEQALNDASRGGEFMPGPWRDRTVASEDSSQALAQAYGEALSHYVLDRLSRQ